MPSLGADMDHGRIIEWLVAPGDLVHRGDLLATVDTDKARMDVESFADGVVAEPVVPPEPVPPPEPPPPPLAVPAPRQAGGRRDGGPHVTSPPVRHLAHRLGIDLDLVHGTGKGGAITRADVERAAAAPAPPATPARVRSSPRARQVAGQLAVDLATVAGTGPGGAVLERDVRRATGPAPVPGSGAGPPPDRRAPERAAAMRRAIGDLMATSKATIPHYYLSTTVDLRRAMTWMQAVNASRPVTARLVPAALLLKATALAAGDVPEVNGSWSEGTFHPSPSVHLGVAVALRGGGLVAPALLDAATAPLDDLMVRLRDLVARARGGRLTRAEMTSATLTVTNLGDLGVESVFGVIYPPQVALVGLGRVVEQPFADGGLLGVRPAVTATLSGDHRVSDGLRGGRFLDRISELLQQPEGL
jgi:pyruvate dehydrogenase E2 component (dihydrolipoamide acetyltransferase)